MSDESKMGRPPIDGGLVYQSFGVRKRNMDYLRRIQQHLHLRSLSDAARRVFDAAEDNSLLISGGTHADVAPEQQG